jgi:hypothetical protein
MELFVLGIYNLANYFALWTTRDVKRYFKKFWPVFFFGNVLIGLAIVLLY